MNHDYAHCADFIRSCPTGCFRAELVRDIDSVPDEKLVSWVHFRNTPECVKWPEEREDESSDP